MEWYVYVYNINKGSIEKYNIFGHNGFLHDCEDEFKKSTSKHSFALELRGILMYYFWSKFEWEISVSSPSDTANNSAIKVDVFDQVLLNWDVFLEYTWNELCKRRV